MSPALPKRFVDLSLGSAERINQICRMFEAALKQHREARIEDYLGAVTESKRSVLRSELLKLQRHYSPGISFYLGSTQADPATQRATALPGDDSQTAQCDALPHVPGDRIGRYRLVRVLGEGTFGIVYLARDEELDRPVAIKFPKRARIADRAAARAYLAEARTLARLEHQHILRVFDWGRDDHGRCFIVCNYIKGGDLSDRLRRGRVYPLEAARLMIQVASALQHAHSQGLVHRDIKPANLLLDSAGQALVADFGLALDTAAWGPDSLAAGTTAYMSPEQAADEVQVLDCRSDIFSLGVVFYELLTGRRPFEGRTRSELLERVRHGEPLPPEAIRPAIPNELGLICLKCLEKCPEDRFRTSGDLARALNEWIMGLDSPSAPTPPPDPIHHPSEWESRLRAVMLIAMGLFAGWILTRDWPSFDQPQLAPAVKSAPRVVNRDDPLLSFGRKAFDLADVEAIRSWQAYKSPINAISAGDPHFRGRMPFDVGDPHYSRRHPSRPFNTDVLEAEFRTTLPGQLTVHDRTSYLAPLPLRLQAPSLRW